MSEIQNRPPVSKIQNQPKVPKIQNRTPLHYTITPILKSLGVPEIWLALIGAIYSRIAPFFALNRIFFPVEEEATLKTKQPIRLQGLFKVTDQIAGRWKTWRIMWQILQLLFPKLLFFPPKKWMNLISNWLSIVVIKYLNWPSPVFGRFQYGCNKVVIEPRVAHLWFQIELALRARSILKSRVWFQP